MVVMVNMANICWYM